MKKNRKNKNRPEDPILGQLRRTQPYREFSQWMDGELEKLVGRWKHLASPNAGRATLLAGRMSKKQKPK
jgi:hypothetical protein